MLSSCTLAPVRMKAQVAVQAGLSRLGVGPHRVVPGERSDAYAVQRSLTPNSRPVIFEVGAYSGDTAQPYLALFPRPRSTGSSRHPKPSAIWRPGPNVNLCDVRIDELGRTHTADAIFI